MLNVSLATWLAAMRRGERRAVERMHAAAPSLTGEQSKRRRGSDTSGLALTASGESSCRKCAKGLSIALRWCTALTTLNGSRVRSYSCWYRGRRSPKMPGKVIPEGASSSPSAAPIRASATAFAGASVIFSAPSTRTVFARPLSRNAQAVWSASDPEPHAASTRRAGGRWGKSEEASAPRPAWSFAVSASMFATTTRSISSGLMPEERRAAVAASLLRSRRLFSHHSPKRVSPEPARKMSCRIFRRSGKERSDVLEVFVVLQVCPLALVRRKRPSVFQHREEERVAPRAGAVGDEEDALSALRFLEHRREADERA